MMAKTGICSIVVIATQQECLFTLHAKKLNQEFSLFKRLQAPKMKGVRTCFTDAVLVDGKFISWLQPENIAYDDGEILEVLLVALTLKR
jgi:hypothetical protein